jgi:hypothetical protein
MKQKVPQYNVSSERGAGLLDYVVGVALIALICSMAVSGLRKDVQGKLCVAGAAVAGDELDSQYDANRWRESDELCRPRIDRNGNTNHYSAFRGKISNTNFPY